MKNQPGDLIRKFQQKKKGAENKLESIGKRIRTNAKSFRADIKKNGVDVGGLKGIYSKGKKI